MPCTLPGEQVKLRHRVLGEVRFHREHVLAPVEIGVTQDAARLGAGERVVVRHGARRRRREHAELHEGHGREQGDRGAAMARELLGGADGTERARRREERVHDEDVA